jgi:hypothetical protein
VQKYRMREMATAEMGREEDGHCCDRLEAFLVTVPS